MDAAHEKLLEALEEFEVDLEAEEILKKVKQEWVLDDGVTAFGDKLKEREHLKQTGQAVREFEVEEKWSPGHYPQLTTDWFIEGLDYCCDYWRYEFKRPLTPPPAPPPSPDVDRKRAPSPQPTLQTPSELPTKQRR